VSDSDDDSHASLDGSRCSFHPSEMSVLRLSVALLLLSLPLLWLPAGARAQASERSGVSVELSISEARADIDRRSDSAAALYGSSVALLLTGALGTGMATIFASLIGEGDTISPTVFIAFTTIGSVCLLGHLITMITAISLDVGVGVRDRRLHEAHPRLFRLTSGAGDVGLGFALDF
jgi:hypothetical protein